MSAMVCRNVLTFDPSETMPPSTKAIDPMAATGLDPNRPRIISEQQGAAAGDRRFGSQNELPASVGDLRKLLEPRFDPGDLAGRVILVVHQRSASFAVQNVAGQFMR